MKKRGFTLIELIVVIVVLAIVSVVAIPKYVDLKAEAQKATANGVYGAANSAVALNFAKRLLEVPPAAPASATEKIDSAADLLAILTISKSQGDWTANGTDKIEWKTPGSNSITYTITISDNETDTAPAVLTFTPAP